MATVEERTVTRNQHSLGETNMKISSWSRTDAQRVKAGDNRKQVKRLPASSLKTLFVLMVGIIALWPKTALGTIICYDTFDYQLGSSLAGQKGGVGFSGPWTAQNNSGAGSFTVVTMPNLGASVTGGTTDMAYISNGNYAYYNNVNLTGATSFTARVTSPVGCTMSIIVGSPTGTPIGSVAVPNTGGTQNWVTVNCPISGASGTQTVYLVFSGGSGYICSVEWFAFVGNGSLPIWAESYAGGTLYPQSGSTGIRSQASNETMGIQYTGNGSNLAATMSRAFTTPLTGSYYGCYFFSANLTGTNGPSAGMGTGSATNTDSNATFFWSGNDSGSLLTNVKANGTTVAGTENISTNTLYAYLFYTNTSTNTTTGWVLTTTQFNKILSGNLLTVSYLNSCPVSSYEWHVFARQTVTGTGAAAAQAALIMMGNNAGQTAYSFTFGGFYISNASLVEASTAIQQPSPQVYIPTQNSNDPVVGVTTPQLYGAVADGVTDCTEAFQMAINAVYNQGSRAGGVVYIPAGKYAFYGNLILPSGVTLHGDWKDWTTGSGGAVGTTFAIYTTGPANGTPFLSMQGNCGVKGINFWYPNQSASSITAYPYTIQLGSDATVQDVVLVNSYQGIEASVWSSHCLISTVRGSPLLMGVNCVPAYDVSYQEDIQFSPSAWEVSGLAGAPSAGGAQEAWMMANGTAVYVGGSMCTSFVISGYNVGLSFGGSHFYGGSITGCNLAATGSGSWECGAQFSNVTLSGVTGFYGVAQFSNCTITGTGGTAIVFSDPVYGSSSHSWLQCQNCTINGTLNQATPSTVGGTVFPAEGVSNLVNCTVNASPQCIIGTAPNNYNWAGFTGCNVTSQNVVNGGPAVNLHIDPRQASPHSPPSLDWSTVTARYQACKPANNALYVVTTGYGAMGNGTADDTAALQAALAAAGSNGGGIVYLPGGHYKTSATLTVPPGVELRGVNELEHGPGAGSDGWAKSSVIQPTAGSGGTTGPVAIALQANSGVRGINISYETQSGSSGACTPFPAAIQGQGVNDYVIGVVCPNAYNYIDLDTYACPNHFVYMVTGFALNQVFNVGNGSGGIIADSLINAIYWVANGDSASYLTANVDGFTFANEELFHLGNCSETLVKGFDINCHDLGHCVSESGGGPNVLGIELWDDKTEEGWRLESSNPSTLNLINIITCPVPETGGATPVSVISTPSFAGTAWFYNLSEFGSPTYNFNIGGGDVGVRLLHVFTAAQLGSQVTGGVFHQINTADNTSVPDSIAFTSPGLPTDTSEVIGNFGGGGFSESNLSAGNWTDIYNNFSTQTTPSILSSPFTLGTSPLAFTYNVPIEASSYNTGLSQSIATQPCSEGGQDVGYISSGWYAAYPNLNLNNVTTFVARVASYVPVGQTAGTISIHLDSPTGTLIGTLTVGGTGWWQTWATQTCPLSGATGNHTVYLVFSGGSGALFNLEWFNFVPGNSGMTQAASFNTQSGSITTPSCNEGGLYLSGVTNGSWTTYNNLNITGAVTFVARVASANTVGQPVGNIVAHLGSSTGTVIATCPVYGTGGWQNWSSVNCSVNLNGASGHQTVCLVYPGSVTVEGFNFEGAPNVIEGASYNSASGSISTQGCWEGGLNLCAISNGNYAVYNDVDLNGVTQFDARVASVFGVGQSAGTISIYLDSPGGTLIGTLPITGTGGWQTWVTQSCPISGATGYHNVYLVFSGSGSNGFVNFEWFGFDQGNVGAIDAASDNALSGSVANQVCGEGGWNLGYIRNGDYAVYNSVDLNGATNFQARVSSSIAVGQSAGIISIYLDGPTGTLIGTLPVTGTGSWSTYGTQGCSLSGASGYHNVYLVFSGTGSLPNLKWFQFDYDGQ